MNGAIELRPTLDPVLFIGGAGRSGTTLLRNLLTAHPKLAVPGESYFIYNVYNQLRSIDAVDDPWIAWQLIQRNRFFTQWRLDVSFVEELLAANKPIWYADLLRLLFAAYAASKGKSRSADKTPLHVQHFSWLASQFPSSRFVHVIRDPRAVCMSGALQPWKRRGIAGEAADWARAIRAGLTALDRFGPRVLEVRYERLVADPEVELRRVCEHARLEYSPTMLDYGRQRDLLPDRHHMSATGPPRQDLRTWRSGLEAGDIALIEAIAGREMDATGYERVGGILTVRPAYELLSLRAGDAVDLWTTFVAPILGGALRGMGRRLGGSRVATLGTTKRHVVPRPSRKRITVPS
ncbi:MAG TPA: sulfotransferase [Mycobacteriales bacterium]|nr:sulfotransferase [Mycobacteriales bacterium]